MNRVAAAVAVCLFVFASCSSSNGTKSAKAGRAPVLIGMISMEGAGRPTLENLRRGTEAAIRYFNAERGGLQGRRIELRSCATTGAPETSASCAQEMIRQHVVAVRGGADLGSAASLRALTAAGIPYLGPTPLGPADFTTPGAYAFSPGGAGSAASADYVARTLKAKKVAILAADDIAGKNLVAAFVKPALLHGGVAASNIAVSTDKTDAPQLGSVVASAAQGRPDAVLVVFPPPACARIMQAVAQLKLSVPVFYLEPCGAPGVLKAVGAAADGVYFNAAFLNVEANAEVAEMKLYRAKVAKYGQGVDPTSVETLTGFATTMTVLNRVAGIKGEPTPASVNAAFKSAVDAPGFLTHSYTCNGKQAAVPAYVSVCNAYVRLFQYKGGHYRDVVGRWISAAEPLVG